MGFAWIKMWLEHVLEFKYLGFVLNEPYTGDTKCHSKVVSRRKAAGDIRSLDNARICSLSVQGFCMMSCS